jgi:anti-sigma-K factor RskA
MGHDDIHELTAAYTLDALDEADAREYEEHLRDCSRCRDELRELSEVAAALAYATAAPPPPPALRERILDEVRRDGSNVVPFRARRTFFATAGLAAVAACAAIGLGVWAFSLQGSLDKERRAGRSRDSVIALIADPAATKRPLSGGKGTLVVGPDRSGALVLSDVDAAPKGKDYEAWVAQGEEVKPAGVFEGGSERLVKLEHSVPPGSTVMVTIEDDGGVDVPEGKPLFRASA